MNHYFHQAARQIGDFLSKNQITAQQLTTEFMGVASIEKGTAILARWQTIYGPREEVLYFHESVADQALALLRGQGSAEPLHKIGEDLPRTQARERVDLFRVDF